MKTKFRALILAVGFVSVSSTIAACDEGSDTVAPEMAEQSVLKALEAAIQDEYRAELIYQKVIDKLGPVRPFVNIINAEVRHSEALARLYSARGIPVPTNQWSQDEIPGFTSLLEACRAGVTAEIENAEIYDRYLVLELPTDVRMVFENNRRASMENHLRAFQRCS